MFRSTSVRLAALYLAAFAVAVIALGWVALATTHAALSRQFDDRIHSEAMALAAEHRTEGLASVIEAVRERDRMPGALEYGMRGLSGPLAGRLSAVKTKTGWSTVRIAARGEQPDVMRVFTLDLPDGNRLMVGDDLEPIEALDALMLQRFGWALLGIVLLGAVGGWSLTRDIHRRLAGMSGTAEAIIDGDLARRVPVRGSGDDLDRLAQTLNRMLDRIEALMESLRQVSNDIAHDLRTPLTRLRQRLEGLQAGAETAEQAQALEAAVGDLDSALETFAALLRIAQIESGARRAAFRPLDLTETARTVVEAFRPSAHDEGRALELSSDAPAPMVGDRELLTQMLANLVENALRHTPPGARIEVQVAMDGEAPRLTVRDDGPGVPKAERARLFDRFYRLEASRSTPGSGLGLALAAAVARLHGASISLADAEPGLEVRVIFPARHTENQASR